MAYGEGGACSHVILIVKYVVSSFILFTLLFTLIVGTAGRPVVRG